MTSDLPGPIHLILAWGWDRGVSALWITSTPARGRPQYRVEWTDGRKVQRSTITDDLANYEVGPLIRLLDEAYRSVSCEITHLVWLGSRNRALIWYTQNGEQKYVNMLREPCLP